MLDYCCVTTFNRLKGGEKGDKLFIGDKSDIRICTGLVATSVLNNHPSQRSPRYPGGYIRFANGTRFDLYGRRLGGELAHIFRRTPATEVVCDRVYACKCLMARLDGCAELSTVAQLAAESAGSSLPDYSAYFSPSTLKRHILELLPAIATRDIKDLAKLLETLPQQADMELSHTSVGRTDYGAAAGGALGAGKIDLMTVV